MPRNLGSVFSNGLPAARATTMPQRLEAALPFLVLVDVKDTLSLHLKHQQASDQYYALSMVEQPGRWAESASGITAIMYVSQAGCPPP